MKRGKGKNGNSGKGKSLFPLSLFPPSPFLLFCLISIAFTPSSVFAQQNNSRLTVEGVVVDSNGAPIVEAQVQIASSNGSIATTSTRTDGSFQLHTESHERLTLIVSASGFARHEQQLSSAQTALQIVLIPAGVSAKVTIAAARIETRTDETASSVVVLDVPTLSTTAAVTLDDALRQVPGFSLFRRSGSRTANPTSQGVSLRGIGASGASRALVLSDGVPLNDPFGGWVYWDRVPRESISTVEIIQGGASHLYGSTALAGLIGVSTKSPSNNHVSLSASYGNEFTPNGSLFMSGTHRDWSASLATEIFRTDGYILVPETQRGGVDTPAGSRDAVMNLRVERKLSQAARLFGNASFFGESRKNGTPLQTNRTHLRQFVFGGEFASSTAGAFAGRLWGGTQVFDQNFSAISADRNSEQLTRVQRVPAQVFGLSGQWSRDIGASQTFVAGVDTREVRGASDELAFVNGRATSIVGAGGRERTTGVYFEDLIRLRRRVFVNLTGRFDRWSNFRAFSATRSIVPGSPTITNVFADRREQALSGHGSVVYKFTEHASAVFAAYRSFRAPTLNELYRSFRVGNVLTLANENLRAEKLTGVEGGVRWSSWQDRFEMQSNVFWNEINQPVANVTLQTTPALITRQRQNLGQTRARGVELHADFNFDKRWNLAAGYLLADSTVVSFPVNRQLEGLRVPQVPRHQFTFQLRYLNPSIATIGVQGRAASTQFDDDQNAFPLAPYFTLDTYVSRQLHQKLELFCAIENVLNQRYEVGKTPVTTLGPPILFRAGFKVQLGSY
ncbi:MAG TPA: TonB-dependent receptor [Pyrinomonadaceae bacterium]